MSLHALAINMASKGRNGDSMLVHMTPGEVHGLQALAMKHGGTLTVNPDTGLPEANFLKSLLPMIAGFALGPAGFGLVSSGLTAGAIVGGVTGLATGSLSKGLMAGLGAYGGFGIGEALTGAGADAMTRSALSAEGALPSIENITQVTGEGYGGSAANYSDQVNSAVKAARDTSAAMPKADLLSAGAKAAMADPMGFAKQNMMPLGMAAAPIMADMMVPTATKMPTNTNPAYIRQYVTGDRPQAPRALAPVLASEFGSRNFSDAYASPMATGGIVALANGGIAGYAGNEGSLVNGGSRDTFEYNGDTFYSDSGTPVDYFAQQFAPDVFAPVATPIATDNALAAYQAGDYATANQLLGAAGMSAQDVVNKYGLSQADAATVAQNLGYTGDMSGIQYAAAPPVVNTSGGLNNLAAANNITNVTNTPAYTDQYTFANINDYIANNNLDAAGIAAAAKTFNVDPAQVTAAQNAQSVVSNVFRNVLGRDPDPNGLDYWTNQIMTGKSTGQEMLDTFIKNAQANKEIIVNPNIKLDEAVKDFGGYKSSGARDIVDEWVRNTLGREVTEADRKQQWYKDAVNDAVMNTYGKAQDIYGGFKTYAQGEATAATAKAINDAKATLAARGLTEADVVKQTGKTIAQLVAGGTNLGLDLYQASQLKAPGAASKFDFSTIQKAKAVQPPISVVPGAAQMPGATVYDNGAYGNYGSGPATGVDYLGRTVSIATPGDIITNPDGTRTVNPNLPGRPYGGFTGIDQLKSAYTAGGGSLGYTAPIPKDPEAYFNKQTDDSLDAYNYLMGKGGAKYPKRSRATSIMEPYEEAVLGYAADPTKKKFINVGGKMVKNPQYVEPKTLKQKNSEASTAAATAAKAGKAPTIDIVDSSGESTQTYTAVLQDDGTYAAGNGKRYDATGKELAADGGMMGYALGGLGTLGGYSDGGRLLKGPGDGVSDSIPATIGRKQQPARLADGEFVVPARIVSELGNGSTEAGARKLYAMMDRVQKARGKTTGKKRVATDTRADKYLPA